MWVALLGPVRAEGAAGVPVALGGVRLRAVLAMLALAQGAAVRTETLVDGLWGEQPPSGAANALQSLISRLRRSIRDAGDDPAVLRAQDGGYRLVVTGGQTDTGRFDTLLARARTEQAEAAADTLDEALALYRGAPLADLTDVPFVPGAAARLTELRLAAVEERAEIALRLDRPADALAVTGTVDAPLREPLVALRMRALHAAGRQSDALTLFERTRVALADELGVDPAGDLRAAHAEVLRAADPPPPTRQELPPRLTSFVGREHDLAALAGRLAGTRLLTVVGPGGAGKTSLATELARGHGARVVFVPLAWVSNTRDVPGAVLGALASSGPGLLEQSRPADTLSTVVEALRGPDSLLLLDNCEHVVHGAADLAGRLLAALPQLRVLATSREPLAITGESLYQLGPLPLPKPGTDPAASASMRLFADRAMAVRGDFDLVSTVDEVAEICTRLDGLPLALELAAARLRSMTVAQVAANLDDRFRLLTSGSRTALPRQRTLHAVVSWSWDLLADDEAELAARLSVFPAPATVGAVERVCAGQGIASGDVLYLLGSLVEKSIVDVVGGEEPRYRMLETIRAFAAERLAERDSGRTSAAFTAHYLTLAERMGPLLHTEEQIGAIATLDVEHDNLLGALRHAVDTADADTASRICLALIWYWTSVRGLVDQTEGFVTDVLRLDGLPEHSRAVLCATSRLETAVPGMLEPTEARELIDACVRTGACERVPYTSFVLPMLALLSRDDDLVRRETARGMASESAWVRGTAHWARSFALADAGDPEAGARERELALAEFRSIGERWGIAMVLGMEADQRSVQGDHAGAITLLEESLALATELGSASDMVQLRWRLSTERMRGGDLDGAWRDMRAAERTVRGTDNGVLVAMLNLGFAELARKSGDMALARQYLDQPDPMDAGALPSSVFEEWRAMCRAAIAVSEKDTETARTELRIAVRSITGRMDMSDLAMAAQLLARARTAESAPASAAFLLGTGEAIRGLFDAGSEETEALIVELRAALGEEGYRREYRRGATLTRPDAINAVLTAIDQD